MDDDLDEIRERVAARASVTLGEAERLLARLDELRAERDRLRAAVEYIAALPEDDADHGVRYAAGVLDDRVAELSDEVPRG